MKPAGRVQLAAPVIAFDVGGTHLRCARVERDGSLSHRTECATPRGAQALSAALVAEVTEQRSAGPADDPEVAIGIAMSGFLDARQGLVREAIALDMRNLSLGPALSEACGLPVRLVNDVNAAAWAEAQVRGCDDLVSVFVGTGVGTGAVCGGQLLEGHRGAAAEGGHLIFRPGGIDCGANLDSHRGCYESYLGGASLGRRAREAGVAEDADGLLVAWRAGQVEATEIMSGALSAMVDLVRLLVVLLDPERVVLGGGVARHAPELLEAARRALDPHPLGPGLPGVQVEAAMADKDAGLLGAAWLAGCPIELEA